ncbi:DUF5987 family protein [Streptomyces sp. AF1A]|jgi:hypothetical protein|uniref:DUF5987 family protein n=1 Tax=Streptomyces sp. AF1A TaxID=3394350 RepID=UPI0039BC7170
MTAPDRRSLLKALVATLAGLSVGGVSTPEADAAEASESWTTQTLEAFADTLIPGGRRFAGDVAVAGAVTGPGAVQAGVVDLLHSPELPVAPLLAEIAALLDARAVTYAALRLIWLPPTHPPFVGLSFSHRTALVGGLFDPDDLDRPIWQVMSLLVGLAFDTAAQQDTVEALGQGHPGLTWLRFPEPDPDGLWRFPDFSYGRPLAALHPNTTASGSPA